MSAWYRHRRNRPFHLLRHGKDHFLQHRRGERHRHSQVKSPPVGEVNVGSWREAPPLQRQRELRKQISIGVSLALTVVALYAGIGGVWTLLQTRSQLDSAKKTASTVMHNHHQLEDSNGRVEIADALANARAAVMSAENQLSNSLPLGLLQWIPFVGRQISGLTTSVDDLNVVTQQGQLILSAITTAARTSHGTHMDIASLAALAQQFDSSRSVLSGLIRSDSGMFGPSKSARDIINADITKLKNILANSSHAIKFAIGFMGGHHSYFVACMNNAEMRDQGMVLSWALMTVNNGDFAITNAQPISTIALSKPAATITDAGLRQVFNNLNPTQSWTSVNAIADFPTSAKWMEAMFAQARNVHVDGVVGVDVATLQALLKSTGTVHVAGINGQISSSNVASLLLHDLYISTPAGSQGLRHDQGAEVARASIQHLQSKNTDIVRFVLNLATVSHGRHLLFYANDPQVEASIAGFGASGSMTEGGKNVVHIAVQSAVKAKLDWYLHTSLRYDIRLGANHVAYMTTTVTIANSAPAGAAPSYALGPDNLNTHVAGEYVARVYSWMPPGSISPGSVVAQGLSLSYAVSRIPPQSTRTVVFNSILKNADPQGRFALTFLPQSQIYPAPVTVSFTSDSPYHGASLSRWTANQTVTKVWTAK